MFGRVISVVSILLAGWVVATPVLARSRVIAQASTQRPLGSVYLSRGLTPGHRYRIDVGGNGHRPFSGNGFEYLVLIQKGRLDTSNTPLSLNGTTPRSFSVTQPVSGGVHQWSVTFSVQLKSGRGLSVRLVDLGVRK